MNILQPEIVIIGKRRYRRNPFRLAFQESSNQIEPYREDDYDSFYDRPYSRTKGFEEENDEPCDMVSCKANVEKKSEPDEFKDIHAFGDDAFKLNMLVNESYFGFIIGRNGEKKSKLELETKTRIKIPKRGQGDWLVIEGKDKQSVDSCRNRITLLINSARHQKPFTHLVTFPLVFADLKTKFLEFRKEVLKKCQDDRGVDDSLFQNVNKLHLTIVTAVLTCESEIDQAKSLLEDCQVKFNFNKKLKVNIRGLEYMNDDPSNVDVLYAQVKQTGQDSVQKIADYLMETFISSGLSKKQFDRVKLHATVMNSLLRQDPSGTTEPTSKSENKDRESFDARNILKYFGDFDFGWYDLDEIHLSLRFSSAQNGYYECVRKITLS